MHSPRDFVGTPESLLAILDNSKEYSYRLIHSVLAWYWHHSLICYGIFNNAALTYCTSLDCQLTLREHTSITMERIKLRVQRRDAQTATPGDNARQ